MAQGFFPFLLRALGLNEFFTLAKVSPEAEKPVAKLVLSYVMSYPGYAEYIDGIGSCGDAVKRHHKMQKFANLMAKFSVRKFFVEPAPDDEDTIEDEIWAKIRLQCR